jgi:Homeodomain-like domain-containing protein
MLQRSTGETTRTGSWLPGTRMYGRNALVDQELVDVARWTEAQELRSRLRLFALAREMSSVRAACRLLGVHHSTYYRWRRQLVRFGPELLRPRERRQPRMPNAFRRWWNNAYWPWHWPSRQSSKRGQRPADPVGQATDQAPLRWLFSYTTISPY